MDILSCRERTYNLPQHESTRHTIKRVVYGTVVNIPYHRIDREFKQITTAGAIAAAVTEKVWGEYLSVVCQIYVKQINIG